MIRKPLVVGPVPLRAGGLGTAAAEFHDGLEALGLHPAYVGPRAAGGLRRLANGRPFRRAFGMAPSRRLAARAVRRSVPSEGWDLAYAIAGSVPLERGAGLRVLCQVTRHPAVEWAALRRGERETGGCGDMSRGERRRREREIERADLVHVTSHAVREELLEAGVPEERLVHSYHGVDLERFRPGPKPQRPKIVFVGPLSLRKGVDTVAELERRLGPEASLVAIGGPSDPWSRRLAERAGFTCETDVPNALAGAHLLVLPSRSDGFSYVVLEALASGAVPVVTPEVGAAELVARLDRRLVVERAEFVEATLALLGALDFAALAPRARALSEEFDRSETSREVARKVLERAERLRS